MSIENNKSADEYPKFQGAVFLVKNVENSKKFYHELLGQKILVDFGRYVGFEGNFGIWQRDFAIETIFSKKAEDFPMMGENTELTFETSEVEKYYKKLKAVNVKFIHPIREQPWGQKVFRFYDPDGHMIEIGEPLDYVVLRLHKQGKTIQEIEKITTLSPNNIKEIIKRS